MSLFLGKVLLKKMEPNVALVIDDLYHYLL